LGRARILKSAPNVPNLKLKNEHVEENMEVFGGFMMMLSIIGFFLTVIWFILPFVIFNIKTRVDRTLFLVEEMEKRLTAIEKRLREHDASLDLRL
jgi:galactitol-specific phosphotransferase system IIC component